MKAYQGQITMDAFGRFLTSYGIVEAVDLGNELRYYDTQEKRQPKGNLGDTIVETATGTFGGGFN